LAQQFLVDPYFLEILGHLLVLLYLVFLLALDALEILEILGHLLVLLYLVFLLVLDTLEILLDQWNLFQQKHHQFLGILLVPDIPDIPEVLYPRWDHPKK